MSTINNLNDNNNSKSSFRAGKNVDRFKRLLQRDITFCCCLTLENELSIGVKAEFLQLHNVMEIILVRMLIRC